MAQPSGQAAIAWPPSDQTGPAYPPAEDEPERSYEVRRAIDRTKTGIVLLAIGAAMGWIPVISLLASLLILIGAFLVILGRQPFGATHERNVAFAIVLYIIGLMGGIGLAGTVTSQIILAVANLPAAQLAGAVVDAFNTLLIGGIVVVLFSGLGSVLFLYALMDMRGKQLLWASLAASVAILFVVWAIVVGQVGAAVAASYATSPPDPAPITALDAQVNSLKVLDLVPDVLLAAAAYVAWSRVERGEIPPRHWSTPATP